MARPARRLGNLPAEATSFIGRRHELAELRKKLAEARLVSLVGPGGVGKSRLAVRIATDVGRSVSDGAWLVELAEVRDPALVSSALLAALDLRDQSVSEPLPLLLDYLRDRQLLVVLDNCEHLLDAAGRLVTEVLRVGSGVRIIATSREPLSISGEHVLPLAPLELPSPDENETLDQLSQNEAVMLFTERAAAAAGRFELTRDNRSAVVHLCRRLDGLPLAIELAAVRTRVLSVEQILDRLSDRFGLLTGGSRAALPRHQTLRTTIDWSYELLDGNERALFRRLCAFAARFTLEDVESVCASDDVPRDRVLELLSSLVDKSMVMKEDVRDISCYRLHETMREYARLKLDEAGEQDQVEARCLEYYLAKAWHWLPQVRYRLLEWLAWAELEVDNIRSVLRACLDRGDAHAVEIVDSLGWYWITRATTEGIRWLDEALRLGQGNAVALFWANFLRGFLAVLKADGISARPALVRAVAIGRELGQPALLSQALSMASIAENVGGDPSAVESLFEEAVAVTRDLDDYPARISLLQATALNNSFRGDIATVHAAASEGVRISRAAGDQYSLEMMLLNCGGVALAFSNLDEAKAFYTEALRIAARIDDRVAEYALLDGLACVAAGTGNGRLAGKLMGAAETIRTQAGARIIPLLVPVLAQAEASAVAAVGQSSFEAEVNAGKRLRREDAIRLGLGEPPEEVDGSKPNGGVGMLAKREAEVARLVASGLSNKQIGARLFISERTVDSHVRSILNKLGFNSRAQIAGWIEATKAGAHSRG